MRIRNFSLVLAAALAACQGSPTAPGRTAAADGPILRDGSPAIGTGLRDGGDSASTRSILMGGGARADDDLAPAGSVYVGGGNRDDTDDGSASTSSGFMGSGSRTDGAATANSGYTGSGTRVDEEEEDSPMLGGGGSE